MPVIPFMFLTAGYRRVVASLLLSTLALFGIGAAITLMTGRSVLFTGVQAAGVRLRCGRDHVRDRPTDRRIAGGMEWLAGR